ncbi:MAG TPA: two-component regulator propeller domain-containing protein [Blastocatellia bacterium]|nr:two-component regulator propeller domain-containing protein [Blastocatellia bacterium]
MERSAKVICGLGAALLLSGLLAFHPAQAEQLPVKTYTIADGLAHDQINGIFSDPRGFMWFCTSEGLSRFDGYQFKNYSIEQGLPNRLVKDMMITSEGDYLVATAGGLVKFLPDGKAQDGAQFVAIRLGENPDANDVTRVVEDHGGTIWCGTVDGLYRLRKTPQGWESSPVDVGLPQGHFARTINAAAFDQDGALWLGTSWGLKRLHRDGGIEHYTTAHGLPRNAIAAILITGDKRIWVAGIGGLYLLIRNPAPDRPIVERAFTTKDGLLHNMVESLFQSSDGRLWVGTRAGLNVLTSAPGDQYLLRGYTTSQGLRGLRIHHISEDRDGNLWVGAENGGAMKITRSGFTSYFEADGIGDGHVNQVFSGRDGKLYVLSNAFQSFKPVIIRFDGEGFVRETPRLPRDIEISWGWNHIILQDHLGDWWIATARGLYHFPGGRSFGELAHVSPRVYAAKDGVEGDEVFCVFEDARGDIWFGTVGNPERNLYRLERSTGRIYNYSPARDGIPHSGVNAFANDAQGNLWMGFYTGGVARYRDGQFTMFTEKDGLPPELIRGLYLDSKQRLWIATSFGGVCRIDDPAASRPRLLTMTTKDGLASNQVTCITEDQAGRIYLGTGRGVDRLEPESGRIEHFTAADGLADNFINVAFRDSKNALWFGTRHGLSRLLIGPEREHRPPAILISGLRIGGVTQPVSELGQSAVTTAALNYTQNQLQIDFLSISYAPGDLLRYQFQLEGAGNDWSAPSEPRTITLVNLSPGSYRLLVRAVNSEGLTSAEPASVRFRILPPIWLRWWFIGASALLVAALLYAFYRYRTARLRDLNAALAEAQRAEEALGKARQDRLVELERVRARIATDLHDDIGSSLTQIAILSEVAHQQAADSENGSHPIERITSISNELVDSMSDIVWAINPKKDHLSDLLQRMRRFASDVFTARRIAFQFRAPADAPDLELGANVRREVFLIFKESVNNIVKHSACKRADIEFRLEADGLVLTLSDDGKGFESAAVTAAALTSSTTRGGNGLLNMRRRAEEMGGRFETLSAPGKGTTATLRMPIAQPASENK